MIVPLEAQNFARPFNIKREAAAFPKIVVFPFNLITALSPTIKLVYGHNFESVIAPSELPQIIIDPFVLTSPRLIRFKSNPFMVLKIILYSDHLKAMSEILT
jgi:hypothetical protein